MQCVRETSNEDRRRIVDAHLAGEDMQNVARVLRLNRSTVHGIVKTFVDEDRVEKLQRGGQRPKKLTQEQEEAIRSWVNDDCSLTLKALSERCLTDLGISISQKTVDRVLQSLIIRLRESTASRNDGTTNRRLIYLLHMQTGS